MSLIYQPAAPVDAPPGGLAILSGGDGWHVRDLARAAAAQHLPVTLLDFRTLAARSGTAPLPPSYSALVVRTMPHGSLEQIVFRMDYLQRLEARGVRVLNPPRCLEVCIDKYLTLERLEAAGLPVPRTVTCQDTPTAMAAFAELGGAVVVKPLFGSEGRGMLRLHDPELAWRTFQTLERTQCVIYLQEYLDHPGWDLRLFVLNGSCLGAMRRVARGDWRTNIAQGGRGEPHSPTPAEVDLALRAARAVGAAFCGVDLLYHRDGRAFVLEVNAVPGWRSLAPTAGVDVAAAVVRFAAQLASIPQDRQT